MEVYSRAFVAALPPAPGGRGAARAPGRARTGSAILSNWPLAATIDRYVEAAGWTPHLAAVVVSQRVGTIKPHPAIFAAARTALGDPAPAAILHVGDDWAADVVGAKRAGWRAAYLAARPATRRCRAATRRRRGRARTSSSRRLDDLEAGPRRGSTARAERPGRRARAGRGPRGAARR